MKIKLLSLFTLVCIVNTMDAQVLYSEDFDSYSTGHLNTDYTGGTIGQGGWFFQIAGGFTTTNITAMVIPEIGRGNALSITTNGNTTAEALNLIKNDIDILWNNRTSGNNVIKLEYEIYGEEYFGAMGGLKTKSFRALWSFVATWEYFIYHVNRLKEYDYATFPYKTWIKAEIYIDYNKQKIYYYIPTLNLLDAVNYVNNSSNNIPDSLFFQIGNLREGSSVVKLDNIKLTALASVPANVLSIDEQFATKFNVFPNPASNVVNITNSENMLIQHITVYDISGKQLSTQNFENSQEIQLNVQNLASGTYMLHIQTNGGTAVKKIIKK